MSSSSQLFRNPEQLLNEYQKSTLYEFSKHGLTAAHFANRGWFNDFYHSRAFSFLVEHKHFSIDQAFAELDQLDKHQAHGILQGLSHDEVFGLNDDQIDAYLKHGLPKAELQGLNRYKINALLALRKQGMQAGDLRTAGEFEYEHLNALIFLITIKKQTCKEALSYLQGMSRLEVSAISYGCEKSEVTNLEDHQINALTQSKKRAGLQRREDVEGLGKHHISMVEALYQFGLTGALVREYALPDTGEVENILLRLVKEQAFSVKEALETLKECGIDQAMGMSGGLTKAETQGLNKHHIDALKKCKTIKNGLSADDLRGKDWFNDEKHVEALGWLLWWRQFSAKGALAEIADLSGAQAYDLARNNKTRDDVVGLKEFQLKALDTSNIRHKGITGSDLRGKDWFNSKAHVFMLEYLLDTKKMSPVAAMQELDGLDSAQAMLLRYCSREKVLKLTPVQRMIMADTYKYGIYSITDELIDATWLETEEQAALLKAVKSMQFSGSAFAVVKKATDEGGVSELLQLIKDGKVRGKELHELMNPAASAVDSAIATDNSRRGCSVM